MDKKEFQPGVYDISNEQYHSANGVSRSALMLLDRSPYHFWYEHVSGQAERREASDAMNVGSAFHTLVLEPHKFDDEFAIAPKVDRRTTAGKEMWEEFMLANGEKILLAADQYKQVQGMADAILKHSLAKDLLDGAQFEQSIFWKDEKTGLMFKVRPDIWQPSIISDLKSAKDAEYWAFQRECHSHGYFLQAGMMAEAMLSIDRPIDKFVHIVAEKTQPFAAAIYPFDDSALEFGRQMFRLYADKLAQCFSKNEWPSYEIKAMTVPVWARTRMEYEPDWNND